MQDTDFSDEFCRFIQTTIPTVEAAELLLALATQPDVWWTSVQLPGNLLRTLRIPDAEAGRYLDLFLGRGLLVADPNKRFRYRPVSEALAAHVRTLAQAYGERPVTLIRMIYALRDAKLRSFADAFKLTRK